VKGYNSAFRPFVDALLEAARRINPNAYITSGPRDSKKQEALYHDYITGKSKYPAAKPGSSKHEQGRAVDIGGMSLSQLRRLGRIWKSWGGRWGGSFRGRKDPIHFDG